MLKSQDIKNVDGLNKKNIKSITLVIVRDDRGNAARHVSEIKLSSEKILDFLDDIKRTWNDGLVDVNEKYIIVIKTKRNKELRLAGQNMILVDKENRNYFKADFNWTIKYWNKDLNNGGL
ncbi:MAG: hypothetical protein KA713_09800 [Chryseotalea sp. WA131a]|jgi:hypothetical protein|nr:MAG: hypothetical protein KA713_09800 [Chryseotalea sp. WA131a]